VKNRPSQSPPPPEQIRLLYAEDGAMDADLTAGVLKKAAPDIALEVVDSGAACLSRLREEAFDLLLLDYPLPDRDGLDVVKKMAEQAIRIPTVLITGQGNEMLVVQAQRLGVKEYIKKREGYLATLPERLRAAHKEAKSKVDGERRSSPRRILVVEDSRFDLDWIESAFDRYARHLNIATAHSVEEALHCLAAGPVIDVILADYLLPDMNAFELIRELSRQDFEIPVIVMTGQGDEEVAARALREGAFDYIVKRDGYIDQLPHAIERAIERFDHLKTKRIYAADLEALNRSLENRVKDRTAALEAEILERKRAEAALRESEKHLRHLAEHDALTGLPNRILFFDRLNQALIRAQRYGRKVALLFLDLDRLKEVNDQFGHLIGDRLLQLVSERLLASIRAEDTVCRLGGDEFVVILPELHTPEDPSRIAWKLLKILAAPFQFEVGYCTTGASIGISLYPDDAKEADDLLRMADSAMYQAKKAGKNHFLYFNPELNPPKL